MARHNTSLFNFSDCDGCKHWFCLLSATYGVFPAYGVLDRAGRTEAWRHLNFATQPRPASFEFFPEAVDW